MLSPWELQRWQDRRSSRKQSGVIYRFANACGCPRVSLCSTQATIVTIAPFLHLPHWRFARIDELQLDRRDPDDTDDCGLFAATLDAIVVRGVGDAADHQVPEMTKHSRSVT